ncbi:MAG: hydantoinase B/oxoprolinase family protein, partial [candidate division NC10 bacterium]
GTCKKAAERIEALAARYGAATIRAAVAELMDRAEARMRRAIRALRDGEYIYEAHLESGRERLEPLTVRARVIVAGETITVDLTGTSPQTAGPTNVGPAMAPTGAFTIIKAFLDPGADVNSGAFRPLTVITPPGTIVNADPPAPCGGMVEVKYCVESAVMGALAQALGGKVTGDLKGGGNHCYVGGPHPRTGETFIFYEYPAGGTGAFEGGDGSNTVRTWTESDMTTLQPIEAVEQLYPLRIERTALREDSGGPGRWRGGLGLTRAVRIQAPATQLSVLAEKAVLPPFGVCGGAAGAPNRFYIRRNGQPVEPSPLPGKVSGFPLEPGDVLMMESSGGGGFGDPLDRDPSRVAADLAEGYVTPGAAEAIYGVVWRGSAIDVAATATRRDSLSAARPRVRLVAAEGLDTERGRAIRLDAGTARRLGVAAGAVVELVNPRGAPLRAWVASVVPGDGRRAEVPAVALRMLALADGAEVEIRAVHSGFLGASLISSPPRALPAVEGGAPAREERGDERVLLRRLDGERCEGERRGERDMIALRARGDRAAVRRVRLVDPHRGFHEAAQLGIARARLELDAEAVARRPSRAARRGQVRLGRAGLHGFLALRRRGGLARLAARRRGRSLAHGALR